MSTELATSPEKGFKIEVNGFDIKANTIYQVIPKADEDAPSGFRKWRTTKIISPDITESFGCVKNSDTQTWDTGFYEFSPCYRHMSIEDRKTKVQAVVKNIKEPIEALKGGGDRLGQSNDEFWDDFTVKIYNGRVFNTSDPKQLLELYMAVLHHKLAPKEGATEESLKYAQYGIIDKEQVISRREEQVFKKSQANGSFYNLLTNDKPKLNSILKYLNFFVDESSSEVSLTNAINNYFEDKNNAQQNIEIFLETIELANTEEGKKELAFFTTLKDLYKKGIVKKEGSEYVLGEIKLGGSFKIAAKKVAVEPSLQEQLVNLLD